MLPLEQNSVNFTDKKVETQTILWSNVVHILADCEVFYKLVFSQLRDNSHQVLIKSCKQPITNVLNTTL